MKETKSITIDQATNKAIEAQMKVENRSYSNMIEWMAKKYLESLKDQIMERAVKRLFTEAKNNKTFRQALKDVGEIHYKPSPFWDKETKVLYASIYMGWLVGRGQYKESNYDY